MADVEYLRNLLKPFPDWPKKGIVFLDIFPLLRDPLGFETLITNFVHRLTSHTIGQSSTKKIDVVVGLDARGFLLGPIIAMRLGAAFVPVRKKGKLPGETVRAAYEKEYGVDVFEMQADAIKPGQNVAIIDDLVATGMKHSLLATVSSVKAHDKRGYKSAKAAGELVAKFGGKTLEYVFIIELIFLNATSKLDAPAYSIIKVDD